MKIWKEVNVMNKNDQEFIVQKIRTQYIEKDHSSVDELKSLDVKVKRPANVFAYIFGSIGAVVMGSGMSLVMTDIATYINLSNPMLCGIAVGIIGMLMTIVNYPIYKSILGSRRRKYAARILDLSDKIMKGQ